MKYKHPHLSYRSVGYKRLLQQKQFCEDSGFPMRTKKYFDLFDNSYFFDTPYQSLDYSWKRQTNVRKQWQKHLK